VNNIIIDKNSIKTFYYFYHMIEQHIIELNEEDPNYRNKEERRHESLNVIYQLKQNNIPSHYPAVKKLLMKLTEYVNEGHKMEFTIPFPEMNKKIKATLAIHKKEECVVVLKHNE
jgi:hypothetical protein